MFNLILTLFANESSNLTFFYKVLGGLQVPETWFILFLGIVVDVIVTLSKKRNPTN